MGGEGGAKGEEGRGEERELVMKILGFDLKDEIL